MNDPCTCTSDHLLILIYAPYGLYQRFPHDQFLSYSSGRKNGSSKIYLAKNIYGKLCKSIVRYVNKLPVLVCFDPWFLYQWSPHDRFLSCLAGREKDSSVITFAKKTSVADPGYLSRIPDPGMPSSRFRIRIKEFRYFEPKKPVFRVQIRMISN